MRPTAAPARPARSPEQNPDPESGTGSVQGNRSKPAGPRSELRPRRRPGEGSSTRPGAAHKVGAGGDVRPGRSDPSPRRSGGEPAPDSIRGRNPLLPPPDPRSPHRLRTVPPSRGPDRHTAGKWIRAFAGMTTTTAGTRSPVGLPRPVVPAESLPRTRSGAGTHCRSPADPQPPHRLRRTPPTPRPRRPRLPIGPPPTVIGANTKLYCVTCLSSV